MKASALPLLFYRHPSPQNNAATLPNLQRSGGQETPRPTEQSHYYGADVSRWQCNAHDHQVPRDDNSSNPTFPTPVVP